MAGHGCVSCEVGHCLQPPELCVLYLGVDVYDFWDMVCSTLLHLLHVSINRLLTLPTLIRRIMSLSTRELPYPHESILR